MWGITDIFYKKASVYDDPLSPYKTFICIGIVMVFAGIVLAIRSETLPETFVVVRDNLYLMPLCIFYALSLFFGLIGNRYLDASVISPLENIDGAIAAIILYFYFLLTGYKNITGSISTMDMIATASIVAGVIFLGFQEHTLAKREAHLADEKKRHRLGALALIFPIVYNLVDAVSMVATGITVSEETEIAFPDTDFFVFEGMGFATVAICMWLYMLIVKKYKYNPFRKEERVRFVAAGGETLGSMAYIFAVASNPILTAPSTSAYCLVTIVLARIFLKERLTRKQYLSLAFLVVGIVLLGISEILKG